uniref:non-specific serine/threonine protein kinase n=1 Tax=Opuntia streptacantha TaxID=393608 RepID=A0A7C9ANH5_OPUST
MKKNKLCFCVHFSLSPFHQVFPWPSSSCGDQSTLRQAPTQPDLEPLVYTFSILNWVYTKISINTIDFQFLKPLKMSYSQMSSALFSPLQLHFSTIIIAVFVIFLSFPTSIGINDWYKECSSLKSCGNISNIGYPFWGYPFRPRHCGHPSFELKCPYDSDGHTTLHIHANDDPSYSSVYQVLGINSSSMTIMLQDFYGDPGQCLIPFSNLTAGAEDLIEYSTRVEKIGLSYGCDPNGLGALATLKSFTCPHGDDNSEQASYYYWENEETKVHLKGLCKESIEVPIIGKDNLARGNITLDGVLQNGFEVNYTKMYLRDCLPCEKSGGHCGCSEDWAFICINESWDFDSDSRKSGFSKLGVILIGSGIADLSA